MIRFVLRTLVFALAVCVAGAIGPLLFVAASEAQPSQGQPNAEQTKQNASADQNKAAQPSIIVNIPPYKTEAEAKEERREAAKKADVDASLVKYTQWLAYATVALGIFTALLAGFVAKQARDARILFVRDQRPWLNVTLEQTAIIPIFDDQGNLTIKVKWIIKNIGKTPAFETGNGFQVVIGYDGAEESFEQIRRFTEAQSFSKGRTLFPLDGDSSDTEVFISKSMIEETHNQEGAPMQFLLVAYRYKSGFEERFLETIRMYQFGVGGIEVPLPRTSNELAGRPAQLRLWKELVI